MKNIIKYKTIGVGFGIIVSTLLGCLPDEFDDSQYKLTFPPRDSLGGAWDIDYTQIYYCPLHTNQINVYPGNCPICGTRMILKPEKDSLNLKGNTIPFK